MIVILRVDFFTKSGNLIQRNEPWTDPKELSDDMLDQLPSSAIIVTPPAGYKFKDGIVRKKATKKDIEPVSGVPVDNSEAIEAAKARLKDK